jgi:hypothetical protein
MSLDDEKGAESRVDKTGHKWMDLIVLGAGSRPACRCGSRSSPNTEG